MGQAKRRGSEEQRIQQGIAKRLQREQEERERRERAMLNLTPQQKARQARAVGMLAVMETIAATSEMNVRHVGLAVKSK